MQSELLSFSHCIPAESVFCLYHSLPFLLEMPLCGEFTIQRMDTYGEGCILAQLLFWEALQCDFVFRTAAMVGVTVYIQYMHIYIYSIYRVYI